MTSQTATDRTLNREPDVGVAIGDQNVPLKLYCLKLLQLPSKFDKSGANWLTPLCRVKSLFYCYYYLCVYKCGDAGVGAACRKTND